MSSSANEVSRFDAENATSMTLEFLQRLGYKGDWLPLKVSLEGDLYVVEMTQRKKIAKVQINSLHKEIKEYEFEENAETKPSINFKSVFFLIAIVGIATISAKLLGVF